MARPLDIEFSGAIYHVTSRGDRREPIFVDDVDRRALLEVLGTGLERFDACALGMNLPAVFTGQLQQPTLCQCAPLKPSPNTMTPSAAPRGVTE